MENKINESFEISPFGQIKATFNIKNEEIESKKKPMKYTESLNTNVKKDCVIYTDETIFNFTNYF